MSERMESPLRGGAKTGSDPGRTPAAGRGDIPRRVLARCFVRSLFLQASWNSRGMQNLGFLHAIEPALEHLYPAREQRKNASKRHLEPFNTQPYMAEAVLGGAIHHETAIADGRILENRVTEFKQALAGPLAALGDTFFWAGLRPSAAALAVLLVPFLGAWAILALFLMYNIVHLGVRLHLFVSGLRLGDGILEAMAAMRLAKRAARIKQVAAGLVGLAAVALVATFTGRLGYPVFGTTLVLVIMGSLMAHPSTRLSKHPYLLLLALALLCAMLGVLGIAGTG